MSGATLLVIQGPDQGTRFEIAEIPVSIGRGVRNDIRILDTEVSRHHSRIDCSNNSYRVTDLRSSNGTFVNGKPVRTLSLASGDQIQVGRTILIFDHGDEEDSELEHVSGYIDLVSLDRGDNSSIVSRASPEFAQTLFREPLPTGREDSSQTVANLQALYRISEEVVSRSRSIDQVLQRILNLTLRVVGADRGCMFLTDLQTGQLSPRVYSPVQSGDAITAKMPVSRTIVDYVVEHGQGVRTSNAARDQRFESGQSILQAGIREAICVPLQGHSELMGVMYIDTTTNPQQLFDGREAQDKFSEEHLQLVLAVGRQAALAIESNRYHEALVKAERLAAMGQTVAMLSHHVKNILQGVRGGSYLIEMGLAQENNDLLRKGWRIVDRNQGRIYDLVMDMLSYSKERKPALESANLNETVADACELMQMRADEAGARLEVTLSDRIPQSMFDKEGIHRALLNIMINAIDAVDGIENAIVEVQTDYDKPRDLLRVSVRDNGSGIPEDQQELVFNVFESGKGAGGTGLGLAVSRKIAHEHGGQLELESAPGHGCQFVLAWPRLDEDRQNMESRTRDGTDRM